MISVKVVIVDDEQLALDRMADMLASCEDVEVIGAFIRPQEALETIPVLQPDVILLDIEMPGLDGFDVVERLTQGQIEAARAPLVVFVTAHPNFAPQAFDTGAVDFLSKPVRLLRLETTLARVRKALADRDAGRRLTELQQSLEMLRHERPGVERERDHVWIHRRGEFVRLNIDEVTIVRAEAEYVRLFTGKTSYLHRDSIGALEARLDPQVFVRIHRSTIVRRSEVIAVRRSIHGGTVARLAGGEEASIGRKYAKSAREALLGDRKE